MRADERHDGRLGEPGCAADRRQHRAAHRARIGERRHQGGVEAQQPEQLDVPAPGPGIQQAGRGRVRALGDDDPGQPMAEQVGQGQDAPDDGERRRPAGRLELVEGVDRQDLEAGPRVEGGRGNARVDPLDRRQVAGIAVVDGVAHETPRGIEEADVDAPGVDANAAQVGGRACGLSKPGEDLVVEAEHVPVEPVPRAGPARSGSGGPPRG